MERRKFNAWHKAKCSVWAWALMKITYENLLPLENGFLCQLNNFQEINEDILKIQVI